MFEVIQYRLIQSHQFHVCAYVHSLLKFFTCIKNWAEMAHLDSTFHAKIHAVERNYEVASVVFNKYYKEFVDIFNEPEKRQLFMKQQKQRKVSRCAASSFVLVCGWPQVNLL